MKTKLLVMLSSFMVLTMLIACISVYVYNAYTTASESSCRATASVNAYGLVNGSYTLSARVDTETKSFSTSFANGIVNATKNYTLSH